MNNFREIEVEIREAATRKPASFLGKLAARGVFSRLSIRFAKPGDAPDSQVRASGYARSDVYMLPRDPSSPAHIEGD